MLILFDNGTPRTLARLLIDSHMVTEARARGWQELGNGELLKEAEAAGFEVLVTTDKNISYQQNLSGRKIAIVVLERGRWSLVKPPCFTSGCRYQCDHDRQLYRGRHSLRELGMKVFLYLITVVITFPLLFLHLLVAVLPLRGTEAAGLFVISRLGFLILIGFISGILLLWAAFLVRANPMRSQQLAFSGIVCEWAFYAPHSIWLHRLHSAQIVFLPAILLLIATIFISLDFLMSLKLKIIKQRI